MPMHRFNSNGKKILHFHAEENKWRFELLFCFVINIFQTACRNIQEPSPLKCWNVIFLTVRRVSAFTTITLTESSTLEWRQGVGRLRRCVTLGCIEYDLPPSTTTTTTNWLWLELPMSSKLNVSATRLIFFVLVANIFITSFTCLSWIWIVQRYPNNSRFCPSSPS